MRRPLFVGPAEKIVGAGCAQVEPTIEEDHFTSHEIGTIRDQKRRQVCKLLVLSDATERNFSQLVLSRGGIELRPSARCWKWAWSDGHQPNLPGAPFNRQTAGHRE